MPEPLSLTWFVIWATAVAVVAVDVGKTKVFAWLRRFTRWNLTLESPWLERQCWKFFDGVVHCPWCLGHWLSAAVCLGYGIMNPVWWFVLTGTAAVPMLVYCGLLWLLEDERLNCE